MIPQEYRDFGLVTIPTHSDCCFRVWKSPDEFEQIQCSGTPLKAYWSGNSVIVEMKDHIRIYNGLSDSQFVKMYS